MSKLLPYETIVKAHEGDPDAVNDVLSLYAGYIHHFSKMNGQVKEDTTATAADKMMKVLEAEARAGQNTPYTA